MPQLEKPIHKYNEARITGTSCCRVCGDPVFQYRGNKPSVVCSKEQTGNNCLEVWIRQIPKYSNYYKRYWHERRAPKAQYTKALQFARDALELRDLENRRLGRTPML